MYIVILEDDHFEKDILLTDLRTVFPEAKITSCSDVGSFLVLFNELQGVDVIITEHYLPLLTLRDSAESLEREYRDLVQKYPWVAERWTHQEAGERLIRHIRRSNKDVPIIIYTHSERASIDPSILADPKLSYCEKLLESDQLLDCVRKHVFRPSATR